MATHPKDRAADNPRIQCVVCGRWKRLHVKAYTSKGGYEATQTFFGGCGYNGDNSHLAHKGADDDVCDECCHIECKRLAGCDCQAPFERPGGAAGVSETCPVHGKLNSTAPH